MNTLLIALILGLASASSMANESTMLIAAGEPVEVRNAERAAQWQEGLLGTYSATFDLGMLKASHGRDSTRAATPAHVARRSLNALLPGKQTPVVLDLTTVYEGTDGIVTHAGTVANDDASLITLSIQGNEVLGKIHTGGLLYLLEGSREADHTLSVIDSARLPGAGPRPEGTHVHSHTHAEDGPETRRQYSMPEASGIRSGGGNVSTLILYTPAVAARNNVSLLANGIIAQGNASLAASGVDGSNYFTLADLKPLASDFTTLNIRCEREVLDQAGFRFGAFSNVDTLMSSAQADIALILVTTEPSYDECWPGVGRAGGAAFLQHPWYPFALSTDTYALGDLTALHEIGHVLGGDHEGGSDGILWNAYGFAEPSCAWQTIMGGYEECAFDEDEPFPHLQPTTRLPRWSNPDINYGTIAMGSTGQDMADALETLMPTVSAWETNPAAPGTTSGFTVWSWLCYGTHTASWSATTGATHYQLMASTSVTFNSPYLIHIASGTTSANFDIMPSETLYLRVRACNAGGCGGYSTQQVADDYYPTCV